MELLQALPDPGYPVEYLLSRIRGRKSRLIADWKPLISEASVADYLSSRRHGFIREQGPYTIWRDLLREYRWVYGQMNGRLRQAFAPFFAYSELRTVFIGLRHLKDKSGGKAKDLLDASLLSDGVKDILAGSPDISAALAGIEPFLVTLSVRFAGLGVAFESGGLRGVEQKLINTYLAVTQELRLQPILRDFFVRLIDARNIMAEYKFKRLGQQSPPPFIHGGAIERAVFEKTIAKENVFGICSLIREFFGISIDSPDPAKVETALYRGITRFLKKEGRGPLGIGPVLGYLWRCSLEAMNMSILLNAGSIEREVVTQELVQ